MKLDTRVLPDIDALSRAALEELLSDLQDAIKQRGRGAIALSGGHTPEKMYTLWAANEKYRNETDWNRVHFFWGDERYVPHDDPLSNYRMTRETLLKNVPIPAANVHAVPTNLGTPQQAAEAYDQELRRSFSARPRPHSTSHCSVWDPRATPLRFFQIPPRSRKKPAGSCPFT